MALPQADWSLLTTTLRNMKVANHTIEILCDLSGHKIGEVQTVEPMTLQEYRQQSGIVDFRCDTCISEHGKFTDLVNEYVEKTGHPPKTAEVFVQLFRKRADFAPALKAIVDKEKEEKGDKINQ